MESNLLREKPGAAIFLSRPELFQQLWLTVAHNAAANGSPP
jgi:hypothetical protein